jgi:hypothetical protein
MTINPVFYGCSKHIELNYHYACEKVALGTLETRFVPSARQLADLFTKPLPKTPFQALRVKLGLLVDLKPTLKGSDNTKYSDHDPSKSPNHDPSKT